MGPQNCLSLGWQHETSFRWKKIANIVNKGSTGYKRATCHIPATQNGCHAWASSPAPSLQLLLVLMMILGTHTNEPCWFPSFFGLHTRTHTLARNPIGWVDFANPLVCAGPCFPVHFASPSNARTQSRPQKN